MILMVPFPLRTSYDSVSLDFYLMALLLDIYTLLLPPPKLFYLFVPKTLLVLVYSNLNKTQFKDFVCACVSCSGVSLCGRSLL